MTWNIVYSENWWIINGMSVSGPSPDYLPCLVNAMHDIYMQWEEKQRNTSVISLNSLLLRVFAML